MDLNKASPKDLFPMPWIDQLVDATAGRLSGLPSNIAGPKGSREDSLCDTYWELSL